jgi:hypothetical protein
LILLLVIFSALFFGDHFFGRLMLEGAKGWSAALDDFAAV